MSDVQASTSEAGVAEALKTIKEKKDELEAQANKITNAFSTVTQTVQLKWLNVLISQSWNTTGLSTVETAKANMGTMMKSVDEALATATEMSEQ